MTLLGCCSNYSFAGSLLLADLVVTSLPAPRPLMEVPVAASTFDEPRVSTLGIQSFEELSLRTPGMNLLPLQGGLSIRGIGGAGPNNAPPVAVHLDGIYMGEWRFLDAANFFDIERIEVLRGPMGVSHGRNALGGAVNLVSTPPPMTWQSKVVATGGSFDYWGLQGLIRGPITDQFAMSVAGSILDRSAWEESDSPGDQVPREDEYLRAAFTYHWNNIWYSKLQGYSADAAVGRLDNAYLVNEVAIGDYRVKYVAAWTDREDILDSELFSHEFRVYSALGGPVNLDAGLQYIEEDLAGTGLRTETKSTYLSAWSELQWRMSDGLGIGLGLRFSEDEFRADVSTEDNHWDWRLALDYRLGNGDLVYASSATGHGSLADRPNRAARVEAQALRSLEAGYKGTFMAQRLQASAAVFHYHPDAFNEYTDNSLGAELEFVLQAGSGVDIGGSWSWADGDRPPAASSRQISLFATAAWQWAWLSMQARVEYLHRSEFCALEEACSRSQQAEEHSQWDLGLSAAYQQWNLTAYIDNLTDERSAYPTLRAPSDWLTEGYLSPPREIGLELVYQLR